MYHGPRWRNGGDLTLLPRPEGGTLAVLRFPFANASAPH
jgi:hypothetical protein